MTKKPIEAPLTAKEIQERLRDGRLKIVSAPQDYVETYSKEVDKLLLMIGKHVMEEDYPGEWASSCFVTDESTLGDFISSEDPQWMGCVEAMEAELGFSINRRMYIYQIAARMHGVQ